MLILLEKLFKWLFIASLVALVAGWWHRDALPEPDFYDSRITQAPRQTKTSVPEFDVDAGAQRYRIKPLYAYELDGMVVSMSHAHSFTDIYHAEWQDFLNLKDICVIWGGNVGSAVYQDMDFSNTTWTCWASWQSGTVRHRFRDDELSNNHLLADRPEVQQAILNARPGDQVRLRGYLAEYRNPSNGFFRGSSITRGDRGQGACETVYVERFEVVREANTGWRSLFAISLWLAPLSLVGFVALLLITPVRRGLHG